MRFHCILSIQPDLHLCHIFYCHGFQGLSADAPVSVSSAVEDLRKHWYDGVCSSPATKVSLFMDNVHFDSADHDMASHLGDLRPEAAMFDLIKFGVDGQSLRVETDRWRFSRPPESSVVAT